MSKATRGRNALCARLAGGVLVALVFLLASNVSPFYRKGTRASRPDLARIAGGEAHEHASKAVATSSATGTVDFPGKNIVYTRIPKTGSTSFVNVLTEFARGRNYSLNQDIGTYGRYSTNHLHPLLEKELLATIQRQAQGSNRSFIHGHFHHIPNDGSATLVSWVRHPVSHFLSRWYSSLRLLQTYHNGEIPAVSPQECWDNHNLDPVYHVPSKRQLACLFLMDRALCVHTVLDYFCGYEKVCSTGSMEARLELAKEHVREYRFIGVLEYQEKSMELFSKAFHVSPSSFPTLNSNEQKGESSLDVSLLPECFEYEFRLYSYIVERFTHEYEPRL